MNNNIRTLSRDLINLLYPYYCQSCGDESAIDKDVFCLKCKVAVSRTNHFDVKDNEILFRLLGRVNLEHGAALFDFIKSGAVQDVIHKLKYGQQSEIGVILGRQFGEAYSKSLHFKNKADYIVPVPLHYRKLIKRGYNQSFMFAKGISEVTGIPIKQNVLVKNSAIKTQTQKTRVDRFTNVLSSFQIQKTAQLENKIILLVDDVLTTGATIEAGTTKLSFIEGLKIQLGVIALAND